MSHLAASLFFAVTFLAAAVTIHMNVRTHWAEILLALKGEWEGTKTFRPAAAARVPRSPAFAPRPRRAAF